MSATASLIRLDGELTIYRAAELKQSLLPLPPGDGPVEIDLTEVTELDSAGLQLLLLVQRDALAAGRPLRLLHPSAAVAEVLALLDLHSLLEPA